MEDILRMKIMTRLTVRLFITTVVFTTGCTLVQSSGVDTPATLVSTPLLNHVTTPTVADIQESRIQISNSCIEEVPSLNSQPSGAVVLQDEITRNVALYDVDTRKTNLYDEAMFVMAVSPDNRMLAYTEERTGQMVILSSTGERLSTVTVPQDWIGVVDWFSLDSLLMEKFLDKPFGLASTIAYRISTSETKEYLSNFPGISTAIPPLRWGNYSYTRAVYDHSLSRVVYPGGDEQGQPLLVLWNLETMNEIIRFHQGYDDHIGGSPQWNKDGTYFVTGIYPQHRVGDILYKNVFDDIPYMGGYDLFRVSRDGKVQRLTYLTAMYLAGAEAFSLSPDEGYIAFWMNLNYKVGDLNAERDLAILNIKTGAITNLCLNGGAMPVPPIWSPDGKYLAISRYYTEGDLLADVVLVDINNEKFNEIVENAIARGWLIK